MKLIIAIKIIINLSLYKILVKFLVASYVLLTKLIAS